jgi:dihydrofolate reductase
MVIMGAAISLDGYINDRSGSVSRLYPDMDAMRQSERLQETIRTTGAVVMGRRTYEMAQGDYTGYEFQNQIFVLTHQPPQQTAKGENEHLRFTFVTDGIASAITQAKAAAGDKNVVIVGGANTAQQALRAGLIDEIELDVIPVLLNDGLRLFAEGEPISLECLKVDALPGLTALRYRVSR